jgi:hypothetical protein
VHVFPAVTAAPAVDASNVHALSEYRLLVAVAVADPAAHKVRTKTLTASVLESGTGRQPPVFR